MTPIEPFWSTRPKDLPLSIDEIHVWSALLDQPPSVSKKLAATLSEEEKTRADRFHFDRDRYRFIVARAVLRNILGSYLDAEPKQLKFIYGNRGKPALDELFAEISALRFNLSHSNGFALYVVTKEREIGCDLEFIRDIIDAEQIAERFFSAKEYADFRTLAEEYKFEAFFNCWTRKEAYIKAIGDGLSMPLDSFDVAFIPGEEARLLRSERDSDDLSRWSLLALKPAPDFAAAIAVEGNCSRVVCRHYLL